jgi:hypothetical protein
VKDKTVALLERRYAEAYRDTQTFHTSGKPWGPDFVEVSDRLQAAFDEASYNLRLGYGGTPREGSLAAAKTAYYASHPEAGTPPDLHALWKR